MEYHEYLKFVSAILEERYKENDLLEYSRIIEAVIETSKIALDKIITQSRKEKGFNNE